MSVDERTDIEYQGTEPVTDLERSAGTILEHAGGGTAQSTRCELTPMEVYDVGKRPMGVLITNIGG